MNQISSTAAKSPNSAVPSRRSRRIFILIIPLLIVGCLLSREYWILTQHHASLNRLQAEIDRRRNFEASLAQVDVERFLVGSPEKTSVSRGEYRADYYIWRGLLSRFHVRVEMNAQGDVAKIDDTPLDTSQATEDAPVSHAKRASEAETKARLARAEALYRQTGSRTPAFRDALRDAFDGLPEAKVSTIVGQPVWNSFRFSRREQRLFAVRFTVPAPEPVNLDFVRWVNAATDLGLISLSQEKRELEDSEDYLRFDAIPDVEFPEIGPLSNVGFGSFSLKSMFPDKQFILWFFSGDDDPNIDFEWKTVLFLSDAQKLPLRVGAYEITEFIGMKTNLPKYAATDEGVRDALAGLDRSLKTNVFGPASFGRILRPVISVLPEITPSTTPGESRWQKIEFRDGSCAAVRVQIPKELTGKLDLFGAIFRDHPGRFGADRSDVLRQNGLLPTFFSRTFVNATLPELIPGLNRLTIFSDTSGVLEPGQDFVLWLSNLENQDPSTGATFVTLTVTPHPDNVEKFFYSRLDARQPRACGKLLGVEVPPPFAPEGCHVLGSHEREMARLIFTPDSRRLVSADIAGRIRVWDVEHSQLEGAIEHPSDAKGDKTAYLKLEISPDSNTLLATHNYREDVFRWNLGSRQSETTLDGLTRPNERLKACGFGATPTQLFVAMYESTINVLDAHSRIAIADLATNQRIEPSTKIDGEIGALAYLPSEDLFAVGTTQWTRDSATKKARSTASVQLWTTDFSKRVQELPLGEFPIDYPGQDVNPVQLSVHLEGRRIAAICERGQLKVWDIGTWNELLSKSVERKLKPELWGVSPPTNIVLSVSLSADGESVATTRVDDNEVSVCSISTGQQKAKWHVDELATSHVAYSSDGKWVATANSEGVIRLWKNSN